MAISDEPGMDSLLIFALFDKTQADQDSLRETSDEVQQAHSQLDRHLRTLTPPRSSSLWIMDITGQPFSPLSMNIADRFSSNPFLVLGIEAESLNELVIAQIKKPARSPQR